MLLPDLKGLVSRQLIAQAMPGRVADIGHVFDVMGHDGPPVKALWGLKGMVAAQALVVVQYRVVNHLAKASASGAAHDATS